MTPIERLLLAPDLSPATLPEQMDTAAHQISATLVAGATPTRNELAALSLFLLAAADAARDMRDIASGNLPRGRERRMTPIGALVERVLARAVARVREREAE